MYVLLVNFFGISLTCRNSINNSPCNNCGVTRGLFEFFSFNIQGANSYNPKSVFFGFIILTQLLLRMIGIYRLYRTRNEVKILHIIFIELSSLIFLMLFCKLI